MPGPSGILMMALITMVKDVKAREDLLKAMKDLIKAMKEDLLEISRKAMEDRRRRKIEEVSADVSRMQALIKAPEDSRNRQMEEVFRQASEMGLGSRQIEWMTNSLRSLGQVLDKFASIRKTTNVTDDTLTYILTRQKNFSNTCGKECIKDVHEDLRGKGKIIDIFQEPHGSYLCWKGRCKHNCEIVIEYFVDACEYLKDEEKAMYVSTAYHEYGKCGCRARL